MELSTREAERADKRRTWKQHLADWQSSGFTQTDYCRAHGLKPHQFTYWKRRFQQTATQPRFLPVGVVDPAPPESVVVPSPLTIVAGNGIRIHIGDDFNAATLKRLLVTLDQV